LLVLFFFSAIFAIFSCGSVGFCIKSVIAESWQNTSICTPPTSISQYYDDDAYKNVCTVGGGGGAATEEHQFMWLSGAPT
jgi:hypothetical protein